MTAHPVVPAWAHVGPQMGSSADMRVDEGCSVHPHPLGACSLGSEDGEGCFPWPQPLAVGAELDSSESVLTWAGQTDPGHPRSGLTLCFPPVPTLHYPRPCLHWALLSWLGVTLLTRRPPASGSRPRRGWGQTVRFWKGKWVSR